MDNQINYNNINCNRSSNIQMKEQLDVCIYARVSKKDMDKRYQEPKNQIEPLKDFCNNLNWNVKFIFVDKKSGADSNRPEFKNRPELGLQKNSPEFRHEFRAANKHALI